MTADHTAAIDPAGLTGFATQLAEASSRHPDVLTIAELPLSHKVNLRIDRADAAPIETVLGATLPTANTITTAPSAQIAWLGPDEWLIISAEWPAPAEHEDALRRAAGAVPVSVVDVSATRTVIALGGSAIREVLGHGCALDLNAARFAPGRCAQTRLALADILLIAPTAQNDYADSPHFLALVRPSFAPYVATWLLDAAAEYLDT